MSAGVHLGPPTLPGDLYLPPPSFASQYNFTFGSSFSSDPLFAMAVIISSHLTGSTSIHSVDDMVCFDVYSNLNDNEEKKDDGDDNDDFMPNNLDISLA